MKSVAAPASSGRRPSITTFVLVLYVLLVILLFFCF
ncbi:hypothetical protein FHT67_001715 [Paenibacillus sp. BK720]|nr:hypothetical protein [Paenibacillus sp. BK720]